MLTRTSGVLLTVLLLATTATAQEQQGSIEGTVRDNTGAVLPGVVVEARRSTGGVLSSTSDANGLFRFPSVLPGTYDVTASLSGFTARKMEGVSVRLGQTVTLEVGLTVGGVAETIQVTSEVPLIDVKSNAATATVSRELIMTMPKGRDFTSVIKMTSGANQETKAGGIQIDGASGSENRFYIDGVDTTNLQTGESGKDLVVDFLEEVQVKSSGYNAEFRGATGGVINVVTKSGTNAFHGNGGTEFQTRGMEGAERRTLRLLPSGVNQAEHVTFNQDDYTNLYPIADLGGPVLRDRLWFYGAFSGEYRTIDRPVTFLNGGTTGTFHSTERTTFATGNVSGQVTKGLRAKFSATINPFTRDGELPRANGTDSPTVNYAAQGRERPNTSLTGQIDHVVSPHVFLAMRVNNLSYDQRQSGIPKDLWYTFSGSPGVFSEVPGSLVRADGFNSTRTNRAIVRDQFARVMAQTDATFFVNAGGQHTIKGGFLFERGRNDVFDAEQAPHLTFNWDASYSTLDGRSVRGKYGYYSWRQLGTQGDIHTDNLGLFIQDSWTLKERLTLNLGLRTEREDIPSYVEGLSGFKFNFSDKLAPRVGGAYDLKGDGKWKLYGSWGLYYDLFKLELPRGSFGGDKWIESYYTLDTFDWPSIGPNGAFPGTFLESVNFRIPANDPTCPECGAIDPDIKPMRLQEFTAGLDHELTPTLSMGMRYIHKQLDRAIEDIGVIVPGLGEVFTIGNPGEGTTKDIQGPGFPSLPRAQRNYDALEARLTKRFSHRWRGDVIYRLSRLYGNYPGLASSDENGRVAPNVERLFDALHMLFDENGDPVTGRLETDRPHELKLSGTYAFKFGTTVALFQQVGSGTPVSRQVNVVSTTPMFYQGRMSDGRLPMYAQTDVRIAHDIRIGARRAVSVYADVINLFDQDVAVSRSKLETRDPLPFVNSHDIFNGFDVQQFIAARPSIRRDPRFLMDQTFQDRRVARLGVKFMF